MPKIKTLLVLILFLGGCSRKPTRADLDEIRQMTWAYSSGYKIGKGDFIEFETNGFYELTNDSVFKESLFIGLIENYSKQNREITIKTIEGKGSVYYSHDFK